MIIGISDCGKFANYENWIKAPGIEIIQLGYKLDNLHEIAKCDGLILSGGEDVNPRLYNQPEFLRYCNPKEIDEKRDEFEWKMVQYAEENQVSLLGICRGMQLINVYFGGTLVPDIPAFGKFNHSKLEPLKDRLHTVFVDSNSFLYKIIGEESGQINSAHHQSVDMPGFGLVACAMSPDGVIEAMERRTKNETSLLLLVQWHPERMTNKESKFSKNIKEYFFKTVNENISRQSITASPAYNSQGS